MRKYSMETQARNPDRPKVLMYYSYSDKIGGPLTYINTIITSDLKNKYDFSVCFQEKAPGGLDIPLLKQMVEKIKEKKPDIVHVHGAQSEGFYGVIASKLAGCKCIVMTVHGFAFDDSVCHGLKHFLYKNIVEPISLQLANKVYCVCKYASERSIVKKNAGKHNYGYIHNSVPELYVSESRKTIRDRYGICNDDVVFCISCRVTRDKGFDILTDIVKQLVSENAKRFKLLVLGDGDYYETFCNSVHEEIAAGQVIMIGKTDRVADYLAAADAFLFPSYHENLSIALLEAGASGLPCIVSNVGGNPEIVIDGKTGYIIHDFSADRYVEKIQYLMDNPTQLKKMQIQVASDIKTRFSVEKMCAEIDYVYTNHNKHS